MSIINLGLELEIKISEVDGRVIQVRGRGPIPVKPSQNQIMKRSTKSNDVES